MLSLPKCEAKSFWLLRSHKQGRRDMVWKEGAMMELKWLGHAIRALVPFLGWQNQTCCVNAKGKSLPGS